MVTLRCSLLECQNYACFNSHWLAPIEHWKERKREREKERELHEGEVSQATGMPRQMVSEAKASMWNTFLLSELVIPVLSGIVWAT